MVLIGLSLVLASVVVLCVRLPAPWIGHLVNVGRWIRRSFFFLAAPAASPGTPALPPLPPLPPSPPGPADDDEPDDQTTPKAFAASAGPGADPVPTFSLDEAGPADKASSSPTSLSRPGLMAPPPRPAGPMAPPPPPSARARARGPGTSTLAPAPSSAPARPSRKVVLAPGHSPLDWARLTGTAPAGTLRGLPAGTPYLRVTAAQLRRQTGRRGTDAWMALAGRVYNVAPYADFHPGGVPELLRGAGRDGTSLFNETHPWVNWEGMLASCLVGLLVDEGGQDGGDGVRGCE
ncbi:hypothetical protein P8C59_001562 [Phyllachora maydis]|uniref:Cytochrome b5 heme-binding domain-containing protein n=1 Tax=Phyllachora maydis TaxID=1825666 RepID=A0AAD9HZX7_9PEZI|nr:hypothetical protein P8C59_001562 [Phyllachora maydis]